LVFTRRKRQNALFIATKALKHFTDRIFSIPSETTFRELCMAIFQYQATENKVYGQYLHSLRIEPSDIKEIEQIPFLPISFFKTHKVVSSEADNYIVFTSSGTGGEQSKHYVSDISVYEQSFLKCFEIAYGPIDKLCLLALLPSYLEREGSSLVYMTDQLIKKSSHSQSGFYLDEMNKLTDTLEKLEKEKQPTLLLGVTYALLDLIEKRKFSLQQTIVMETGGMKGRRKEMIREELHEVLSKGFGVDVIHSEYGMTELLSQAYSKGNGIFNCPPWMRILIRETNDPLSLAGDEITGGINVIDLANVNSCSFIATQDLGKTYKDGSFEVLGRFDNSDLRGCNLLIN
jgi:phenylacetate-coenzyme A ligase PaaK-like adenylate-forming protein